MKIFGNALPASPFKGLQELKSSSLKTKLVLGMIPPVVLILVLTGVITYLVSARFIGMGLERTAKLQTAAMAHEIEQFLQQSQRELLYIAQLEPDADALRDHLERRARASETPYRILGFIPQTGTASILLVAQQGGAGYRRLTPEEAHRIRPVPMLPNESVQALAPGQVWISPVVETEMPMPAGKPPHLTDPLRIVYLTTPAAGGGAGAGTFLLGVDAHRIRDILSVFNSPLSPLHAFERTPEVRYSFLFDPEGWILFQSGDPGKPSADLGTDQARAGLAGTLGRPGLPAAFRPASRHAEFWQMVRDVGAGRKGLRQPGRSDPALIELREHFLAYAPVSYRPGPDQPPKVYAGLAYVDVSRLPLAAGYKQVDVMFVIILCAVVLVSLFIFVLGRILTRPIMRLAQEVDRLQETGTLDPIRLSYDGYEIDVLQGAINRLIETVRKQLNEILRKEREIADVSLKERASLGPTAVLSSLRQNENDPIGLVGAGPRIEALRSDIRKAAMVDVDVLILGETGTGKQLAAEAIHRLSPRAKRPFVSINCGALDENLLLDTLFGHTRGAFTEAKAERKGAFLEAQGGTLLLDEIQAASSRVQQALLRSVAVRKIKPLGSDSEIDVDVRIVAASNADLRSLIEEGRFREDLYYRLKVITLHTPPLREHRESIPLLAAWFLQRGEAAFRGRTLGLSKGALARMMRYPWPGNVRELKNGIVRAAVMAEGNLIHSEDLCLECEDMSEDACASTVPVYLPLAAGDDSGGRRPGGRPGEGPEGPDEPELNPRQRQMLARTAVGGALTRSDYLQVLGGSISPRTAVYDLRELVQKGFLRREGSGPATRYTVIQRCDTR